MPYERDHTTYTHGEHRRAELGHDRLFLRPPMPTAVKLDELVAKLSSNRSLVAAYAIKALSEQLENASEAKLRMVAEELLALEGGW